MYLMYVDESGDCGIVNSPTKYFVLTGIILHEALWYTYLNQLIAFRRRIKSDYGMPARTEIHASALINKPGTLVCIPKYNRLAILRHFADELATMKDLNIINVVVDKSSKLPTYDVFGNAWRALIQRFENTIVRDNFRGPLALDTHGKMVAVRHYGLLFPDRTDDKKLTGLIRKLRRHNPIPNQSQFGGGARNLVLRRIIEDPNFRDSEHSLFIQAADVAAFLLYQNLVPNQYMRKKGGHMYFYRYSSVLCRHAASRHSDGIVEF